MRTAIASASVLLLLVACSEQGPLQPAPLGVIAHSEPLAPAPERRAATDERIASLQVAPGFRVRVFARNAGNARALHVLDDGTVLVARPASNDVLALQDLDGDGRADARHVVVDGVERVHRLAHRGRELFLATPGSVLAGALDRRNRVTSTRRFLDGLPSDGPAWEYGAAFGPDGAFYLSVGGCRDCPTGHVERAALLRVEPDGVQRVVFARGLRHTLGFGWHPRTARLWGMDIGAEDGEGAAPDELNLLTLGQDYGWRSDGPRTQVQHAVAAVMGRAASPDDRRDAVRLYPAHGRPTALVFYDGVQFPPEYRGDAFVAMRGVSQGSPASAYRVVRIRFDHGEPTGFEDFVSGWLIDERRAHFGRVSGLAVAWDGALLISDDANGIIYRVEHTGHARP